MAFVRIRSVVFLALLATNTVSSAGAPEESLLPIRQFTTGIGAVGLDFDAWGNLFALQHTSVSAAGDERVYRIDPDGDMQLIASGLGGPGVSTAQGDLAISANGHIFASTTETDSRKILRITPEGDASEFVSGIGAVSLAFDSLGYLFALQETSVSAIGEGRVYRIDPDGNMQLIASGLGGPVVSTAQGDLAIAANGNVFVSVQDTKEVLEIIIPDPATLSLLALGGLAVVRRRRS